MTGTQQPSADRFDPNIGPKLRRRQAQTLSGKGEGLDEGVEVSRFGPANDLSTVQVQEGSNVCRYPSPNPKPVIYGTLREKRLRPTLRCAA